SATLSSETTIPLAFTGAGEDGIELGVKESNAVLEYVTLKAYQFPAINILWLGVIVMVLGFLLAARNQVQKARKNKLRSV
ncbi:MAG TPA: hypothetical protein PKE63_10140, partial [Lacibacter sp.]|nr:hypothetical protein [Lacibacter sp.]